MQEADYSRITYDLTLAAADTLARLNPGMTFIYVSGTGTDSTERGRIMWARVKGATENALLKLPFKAAYMFRPGIIRPLHGVVQDATVSGVLHAAGAAARAPGWAFPDSLTTTEQVGGPCSTRPAAHPSPCSRTPTSTACEGIAPDECGGQGLIGGEVLPLQGARRNSRPPPRYPPPPSGFTRYPGRESHLHRRLSSPGGRPLHQASPSRASRKAFDGSACRCGCARRDAPGWGAPPPLEPA